MNSEALIKILTDFKNEINENINEKISKMSTEFKTLMKDNLETIKKQELRINYLEREIRKKNLIIHGVTEVDQVGKSLENLVLSKLNNLLEIDLREEDIQ